MWRGVRWCDDTWLIEFRSFDGTMFGGVLKGTPPYACYGTHSLRRTKLALIYKRTGNLRAVQILLGHTKLESTVRYLGVDAEDALTLSEATDV